MYVRNGIGAFWDKALQFATDAGAAITGATAGQKWGDVVRNVGGSFNSAVFGGPGPQPAPPPPMAPSPTYAPAPRPFYAPAPPRIMTASAPTFMPMQPGPEEKRTNWLLYGGIGAGAIVLYLLLRKPAPGAPR
jgi:hypothetical protein